MNTQAIKAANDAAQEAGAIASAENQANDATTRVVSSLMANYPTEGVAAALATLMSNKEREIKRAGAQVNVDYEQEYFATMEQN